MAHEVAKDFPWSRLAQPKMGPSKAHDLIVRSLRRIGQWGVKLGGGNRLERVEGVVRQWAKADQPVPDDRRELALIAESIRTAIELYYATHGPATAGDAMADKLRHAAGGADLPWEEEQHFSRDIQFELYVHGLLHAGGVGAWFDERPDLRYRFGDEEIGIAVKRLWSREGAHSQLSDGARQIAESGLRGLIAANAQEYLRGVPLDETVEVRGTAFDENVARLHGQFPYLAGKPHIVGLAVCGTAGEWTDGRGGQRQLRVANYTQFLLLGNTDSDEMFANYFYDRVREVTKEWIRVNL